MRLDRAWLVAAPVLYLIALTETLAVFHYARDGTDFQGTIYGPARAALDGQPPYDVPGSVYPPSAFLPAIPLARLGWYASEAIWLALLVAAAILTLHVLGVRDIRCHLLWLLNPAMLSTILVGNATVVVILCVALLWRWRDRSYRAAACLVAAVGIKLFVAPLWLWLVMTRRYRAAVATAFAVPLVIFGSWALIGFSGLRRYPSLLDADNRALARTGPFLQALLIQAGGARETALLVALLVALGLVVLAWRTGDELTSFALVGLAAVIASPVAWVGYAGVVLVAFAARRPRYDVSWLLLLAFALHWWWSPVSYSSAALSVVTLSILFAFAVAVAAPGLRYAPPLLIAFGFLATWLWTNPTVARASLAAYAALALAVAVPLASARSAPRPGPARGA